MQRRDVSFGQDDRLRAYAEAMLPCFEKIQESAARLAGQLVEVEVVGRARRFSDESSILGLTARDAAVALLAGVDSREADAHFHHHVTLALQNLCRAWSAFESVRLGLVAAPDPLPALRAAWVDMQAASRILPGFDTVDFRSSCCAMHQRVGENLN